MGPPRKEDDAVVVTNPDPTAAVKEALELAVKNIDEKFATRDQATSLAREELKEKLKALQDTLQNAATERAIANKDLVEKLEKANQVALTAALQTQKESAAKSELSMADIVRQLQVSFETANKATNEKIDRLTSRLDTGEGGTRGAADNRQVSRQDMQDIQDAKRDAKQIADSARNFIVALIGAVLVATGIIVSVMLRK